MEPSLSPEPNDPVAALSEGELDVMFSLARQAIEVGLAGGRAPAVDVEHLPPALREPRGAFVTLEVDGALNGCIGTLESSEPLGAAVARCAWEAAFGDPRLPSLTAQDYPRVHIKVSILGPLEPIAARSEAEVLAQLRPGIDGLVIARGINRATFLPAVWKSLPDPLDFLRHLEHKAGLPPGRWPRGMRAWRYTGVEHRRAVADMGSQSPPSGSSEAA
ncbi:MAG: AmmeMemoRadiSam system protein A [Actinobacteria bacterium]|nr:AmmeMemoRadiSam system protein A [Actinomycetota bacterium]